MKMIHDNMIITRTMVMNMIMIMIIFMMVERLIKFMVERLMVMNGSSSLDADQIHDGGEAYHEK